MFKSIVLATSQTGIKIAILFIWIYQKTFSKIFSLFGLRCKYYPTCSCYAKQAIEVYGICKGIRLTAWRLLRCQPLGSGGCDPVIKNRKG